MSSILPRIRAIVVAFLMLEAAVPNPAVCAGAEHSGAVPSSTPGLDAVRRCKAGVTERAHGHRDNAFRPGGGHEVEGERVKSKPMRAGAISNPTAWRDVLCR